MRQAGLGPQNHLVNTPLSFTIHAPGSSLIPTDALSRNIAKKFPKKMADTWTDAYEN